ncbi:hypothetical protein [Lactiplantibacillus plantarum]|uniref:hypothetical protein n=1 Tax=Lactiplantibacillus plantarum TaxID=1590 RepID=UPI001BA5B81F|nr:hypothetical protein [Lactiplantibacillus plantarum]MBS0955905.1 hypothetical protein [Lactiplantibacillus plantarum]
MKDSEKYISMSIVSGSKVLASGAVELFKTFSRTPSKKHLSSKNYDVINYAYNGYKRLIPDTLAKQGIKSDYQKIGKDLFKALNNYERKNGFKKTRNITY